MESKITMVATLYQLTNCIFPLSLIANLHMRLIMLTSVLSNLTSSFIYISYISMPHIRHLTKNVYALAFNFNKNPLPPKIN